MRTQRTILAGLSLACATGACGGRSPYWETSVTGTATSYGLARGVALVDDPDHRVVILTALAGQRLARHSFPVGHNVTTTTTSPDGNRLLLLSTGDWPRRNATDDPPSLTVIDATTFDPQRTRYTMSVPLPNLAIDPVGHWAVAYAGSGMTTSFLQNPNEIVIFDLTAPESAPTWRTLQSFGGTPQRLTFTPTLKLPNGPRRLLIIESDIDVTMLDLDNAALPSPPPEITVRLTSGVSAQQVKPAGVVVDAFDSTDAAHARMALRAEGDSNVFTFTFGPADPPPPRTPDAGALLPVNDFKPISNLTDVGGPPSDIAFVRTDGGLRVAALVPTKLHAVLVDPDTSITTQVALTAGYEKMSLVTSVVGGGDSAQTDVAMLWGARNSASGVALWTLGSTVGRPYFSVEVLGGVSQAIQTVDDVAEPNTHLKVLETADGNSFFVLNLRSRTASPLTTMGRASLAIAPDGLRLWAFAQQQLAQLDFKNLKPVQLTTDAPIDAVYDVARPPIAAGEDGGRSLIAIHNQAAVGATVFDAFAPLPTTARRIPALLLEGP